jgi:hypothetical protein
MTACGGRRGKEKHMKRLALGLALLGITAVAAVPATANVPKGNGHVVVLGIPCGGADPELIRLTRNLGKSAWVVETEQHYVVSMFSITSTFVPGDGSPPVVVESFTNTFGNKVGLGEPVRCEGGASEPVPGGALETVVRGEIRFVPPGR